MMAAYGNRAQLEGIKLSQEEGMKTLIAQHKKALAEHRQRQQENQDRLARMARFCAQCIIHNSFRDHNTAGFGA